MRDECVSLSVYEAENRTRATRLKFLGYAEMCAMPEPRWLIDNVLLSGSSAVMFGRSNSFKSFLAIDLALCVATGRPWHGSAVDSGRVLLVATEGANGVGRLRIPAWFNHHRATDQNSVFLYPKELCLDFDDQVSALIAAMKAIGSFALLVLDIFGGTMLGSEIEDRTARAWVQGVQRILRETGASVLAVAHTGWQDESRARMHTHFWGSFDTRLKVEGDKDALTASLTVNRHKDADSCGSWTFRLERSEESLVPVLDDSVKVASAKRLPAKMRTALEALDDALGEHGVIKSGTHWPENTTVVMTEQWRKHFYRHCDGEEQAAKRQAFKRAKDGLLSKELIGFYDDHVWLKRRA